MLAIRTENLTKTYSGGWRKNGRTEALRGLDLEVRAGEVFGFLGPNGAGKTTTIHLLLNLIKPTAGAAWLFGQPVSDVDVHRRLGYLPESVNLHDYYQGTRLLQFYATLLDMPRTARDARVAEVLKLTGMDDAATKPVSKYSKGMLQRIGLGQALLNDPDLLILDEPNSNLDPVGRKEFREILQELKQRGKTVFICSHILAEVESVCDRVAILRQGQLLRIGTLQELSAARGALILVTRLPGTVVEELTTIGARITMEAGRASIACPDETVRQRVETLLAENHVEIQRVEVESQSLEDIFFSTINEGDHL